MRKRQGICVKKQAVRAEVLLEQAIVVAAAVLAVAHDGMVDMREVLADLAEASGLRFGSHQGVPLLLVAAERDVHFDGG